MLGDPSTIEIQALIAISTVIRFRLGDELVNALVVAVPIRLYSCRQG